MSASTTPYVLRTAADMLGMVPYLLGFHPSDSLVALFIAADHRARGAARVDIDTPADLISTELVKAAAHRNAHIVVVIGYGSLSERGQIEQVAATVAGHVREVYSLLVTDGRYFCVKPGCACPATDGVAVDPMATAVAAQSTVDGMVALPSREALLAQVQPDLAAQAATSTAMSSTPATHDSAEMRLRSLLGHAQAGMRLNDEQIAFLAQALSLLPARDLAWQATRDLMWQRDLWLDVTRRVPDEYVTAPATLAAWCCWLRGECTLALAAVQRVLAVDPRYTLALLIVAGLEAGVPARDIVGNWPPLTDATP